MGEEQSYTAADLEALSGFDRRTIAYYVQEELLPRVGRRGRGTRYSRDFLNRLLFIRRVRDLQDAGRLRAVTLQEIRSVMDALEGETIAEAATDEIAEERIRGLFAEPDLDTSDRAIAVEDVVGSQTPQARPASLALHHRDDRKVARAQVSPTPSSKPAPRRLGKPVGDPATMKRLSLLLRRLDQRAARSSRARADETTEVLRRVPITEEILLSVRHLDAKGVALAEEIAMILRELARG